MCPSILVCYVAHLSTFCSLDLFAQRFESRAAPNCWIGVYSVHNIFKCANVSTSGCSSLLSFTAFPKMVTYYFFRSEEENPIYSMKNKNKVFFTIFFIFGRVFSYLALQVQFFQCDHFLESRSFVSEIKKRIKPSKLDLNDKAAVKMLFLLNRILLWKNTGFFSMGLLLFL